jgi:Flp pilus assembly protein TadD
MTTPFRKIRLIVPRWPAFRASVASGTLAMPRDAPPAELSAELVGRLERWREAPDVVAASEAVETAIVDGHEAEGVRAARSLLASSNATPLVKQQARLLLQRAGEKDDQPAQAVPADSTIAAARHRTRLAQRDPFAWADLSRAYLIARKTEAARRSMLVARQLAPHNRHVLRSAARLYLHLDDPEQAHNVLQKNPATRTDPWLMAGEIALSRLVDRSPTFFKSGAKLIEAGGIQPKQITELAAAIGTVHLLDGNRRANKLFSTSLIDPTGNSLAQAEWASPKIGRLVNLEALRVVQDSAEANVFEAYWNRKFPEVIQHCERWQSEEPYSSRPFQFGAVAANTIELYEVGAALARKGLLQSPGEPSLINNLAFALISLGQYDEAAQILTANMPKALEAHIGALTATAGMLAIRTGDVEVGQQLYENSIKMFRRLGNQQAEVLAMAYYVCERARAGLPHEKQLQEAIKSAKQISAMPELEIVMERAKLWSKAIDHRERLASGV